MAVEAGEAQLPEAVATEEAEAGDEAEAASSETETEAPPAEEVQEAAAVFGDVTALPEIVEIIEEELFEDEEEVEPGESAPTRTKSKGQRQRRRTVVYDDSAGETFVVRKHRRRGGTGWDDFDDGR